MSMWRIRNVWISTPALTFDHITDILLKEALKPLTYPYENIQKTKYFTYRYHNVQKNDPPV